MPQYEIAAGFNNSAGLAPFAPQPKMPRGLEYPEVVFGGDLSASQIGTASFDLVWSNTISRYGMNYLLTQAGLNAAYGSEVDSAQVTVRVRDNAGDAITGKDNWIVLNAVAQRPRDYKRFYIGWSDHVITFQVVGFAS